MAEELEWNLKKLKHRKAAKQTKRMGADLVWILFEEQEAESEAWELVEVSEWVVIAAEAVAVAVVLALIDFGAETLEWVDFWAEVLELVEIAAVIWVEAEVLGWAVAWLEMGVARAAWLPWIQTF